MARKQTLKPSGMTGHLPEREVMTGIGLADQQ